jgi:hypothetical protein
MGAVVGKLALEMTENEARDTREYVDGVMATWASMDEAKRDPTWKAPTREGVAREYAEMLAIHGVAPWVPGTERPPTRDEFRRELGIEPEAACT